MRAPLKQPQQRAAEVVVREYPVSSRVWADLPPVLRITKLKAAKKGNFHGQ